MRVITINSDIVVVGSGVAGLSFAQYIDELSSQLHLTPTISIITKSSPTDTNTQWAQGGIASVVSPEDSFENHFQDTLIAGDFRNIPEVVKQIVNHGPEVIADLERWGMRFDRTEDGSFHSTLEGGHSFSRILHSKDNTGKELQRILLNTILKTHTIYENHLVFHLVIDQAGIFHLFSLSDEHTIHHFISTYLVIATGGLGQLFEQTSNAPVATGDGIFIALQAGAEIENLSFIQFHPTGLFAPGETQYLVTEALRGEGAILKDKKGIAFMHKYDSRAELAPRDIVSRSIYKEMVSNNLEHVYLDATHLEKEIWEHHFPNLFSACLKIGVDPRFEPIPVLPIQHYSCGGIKTNVAGETTVKNLYALGEVASTGLHGSNRLASNSLLEGLVCSRFAASALLGNFNAELIYQNDIATPVFDFKEVDRSLLVKALTANAGIEKTNKGLHFAKSILLEHLNQAKPLTSIDKKQIESNMMIKVGLSLIEDALLQDSNTGVFYKTDSNIS